MGLLLSSFSDPKTSAMSNQSYGSSGTDPYSTHYTGQVQSYFDQVAQSSQSTYCNSVDNNRDEKLSLPIIDKLPTRSLLRFQLLQNKFYKGPRAFDGYIYHPITQTHAKPLWEVETEQLMPPSIATAVSYLMIDESLDFLHDPVLPSPTFDTASWVQDVQPFRTNNRRVSKALAVRKTSLKVNASSSSTSLVPKTQQRKLPKIIADRVLANSSSIVINPVHVAKISKFRSRAQASVPPPRVSSSSEDDITIEYVKIKKPGRPMKIRDPDGKPLNLRLSSNGKTAPSSKTHSVVKRRGKENFPPTRANRDENGNLLHVCPATNCKATFAQTRILRNHLKEHKVENRALKIIAEKDRPSCEIIYHYIRGRNPQPNSQQDLKPYHACTWKSCDKVFLTNEYLQQHLKNHIASTTERNIPCPYCDKRCRYPHNLQMHVTFKHGSPTREARKKRIGKKKKEEHCYARVTRQRARLVLDGGASSSSP